MAYRGKHGWMYRNDGYLACGWGGAREGSGRKPLKKHTDKSAHSFWCTAAEYEYLKKCLIDFRKVNNGTVEPAE